jgi:hypothetical protein
VTRLVSADVPHVAGIFGHERTSTTLDRSTCPSIDRFDRIRKAFVADSSPVVPDHPRSVGFVAADEPLTCGFAGRADSVLVQDIGDTCLTT